MTGFRLARRGTLLLIGTPEDAFRMQLTNRTAGSDKAARLRRCDTVSRIGRWSQVSRWPPATSSHALRRCALSICGTTSGYPIPGLHPYAPPDGGSGLGAPRRTGCPHRWWVSPPGRLLHRAGLPPEFQDLRDCSRFRCRAIRPRANEGCRLPRLHHETSSAYLVTRPNTVSSR